MRAGISRLVARRVFSTAPAPPPQNAWARCIDAAGLAAARPSNVTHDVMNQPPPLADYNAARDPSLRDALKVAGCDWAESQVYALGTAVGSAEWQLEASLANAHTPKLHTHDRHGMHIDRVEYHSAYHNLMRLAFESGVPSLAWQSDGQPASMAGSFTARGALMYLMYQLECGVCCPTTMTFAATPAIAAAATPNVAEAWVPKLVARAYDGRDVPLHEKAGGAPPHAARAPFSTCTPRRARRVAL